jgi:peptidoglycan hydrolase-like protein with peptidoglycan-binding domain
MHRLIAMLSVLVIASVPAVASAQTQSPVAPPLPPSPPPAPVAPVAPVQTQTTLTLKRVGDRSTVLAGSPVRVRGTTGAFVAGESVTVRFFIAGRLRAERSVPLSPQADGTGAFKLDYTPRRPGTLKIRAVHDPTPALGPLAARAESADVIPRSVPRRAGAASIRALQRRLRRLGYVTGRRGSFDARTARAVLAFRKVTGMKRTTSASLGVMRAIARGEGRFKIRFHQHGRHIEADLSRQVIALIQGGRVRRIYPVSSGAPGTPTVQGSFKIYLKTPGTNSLGMVDAAYFIRGYATHGYASVPVFPASHGCLRVPLAEARRLFRWVRIGTPVDVYP